MPIHFDLERPNSACTVTHGRDLFLDSQELLRHGMDPSTSRIFFHVSYICPDGKTKSNLTWHGDQTSQEDYRSTKSPDLSNQITGLQVDHVP